MEKHSSFSKKKIIYIEKWLTFKSKHFILVNSAFSINN